MMTTTNETKVTASTDVPTITIVRELDAPPAKVFRAHADPELLVQWWGPEGTGLTIEELDCRPGGTYRFVHGPQAGGFEFRGVFHTARPGELIVQTQEFSGASDNVALERLVFEDLGDGRTRLTSTTVLESFETRDAIIASGMEEGVHAGYRRLDDLLGRMGDD